MLVRRLVLFLPGVWFVATIVFIVMRVIPGDPAATIVGENAPLEVIEAMRVRLGLDQPLWQQYASFLFDLVRGDLGRSLVSNQPVTTILASVLPHTVALAFASAIVGVVVGIPAGLLAGVRRGSASDVLVQLVAAVLYSVPVFYSGVILLVIFAVGFGWFPMISSGTISSVGEYIRQLTLPALSLGLGMAAYVMRVTRATLIEILSEDYVRTAHAKGLARGTVLIRHALRNALVPIVTIVALYLGILIGGAVLTESVFNRPGVGKVLLGAIQNRDYVVVQSTLVMYAILVMAINVVVDVLYVVIDPAFRRP
jgi:ABC-type dipeptide/oligopeptide/nickel transport system permease component